ncbi:MAG: 16S rRNA (cytosine(1402)-N(4))-methyltransferase RsmH [Oscillospiraceae bacterium]|nr:16S rRNA (cytosine(1402)-N(4))-methyltransferase RsmH [Oscillospiraceae bacterium]
MNTNNMSNFNHTTVLLNESVDLLDIKENGFYIDCTTGGGGHSLAIAERLTSEGRLICFDLDGAAVSAAQTRLAEHLKYPGKIQFINANFADMADYEIITEVNGVLMDLGVSSHQLDTAERGFSFHEDAPLDMRLAQNPNDSGEADGFGTCGISAYQVVNDYPADRLIEILYEYGEERYARGIIGGLIKAREVTPIKTTGELAEIIRRNVPLSVRNAKNPCRKTFQAIRIEVNNELGNLSKGLEAGFNALKPGGRLAVITFHSLEDRIVKKAFTELTKGCDCPRSLPICVCGKKPKAVHVTRKPVTPGETELETNRRARSAKLRVIEKK